VSSEICQKFGSNCQSAEKKIFDKSSEGRKIFKMIFINLNKMFYVEILYTPKICLIYKFFNDI